MRIPAFPSTKLISPFVLLLALAFCPRVSAQFNPIQSAKDAWNKAKQQQQQQKPAQQGQQQPNQQAGAPDNSASQPATAGQPSAQPASAGGQPANADAQPASAGGASQGAWQPPSDTPAAAAAPAGPLDPAKLPDVVGIHMGMPREDVPGILLKLAPGNQIQPEGPDTVAGLLFSAPPPAGNIHVEFTLPPGKQRVYFIDRQILYKQPMTHDNFLAAIHQKYGQEIFRDSNGQDLMYWLFDEQGHPIPPDKNAQQRSPYGCGIDVIAGGAWFDNRVRAYLSGDLPPATFCDSVIVLSISAGPRPEPIDRFSTTIEDRALLRREVIAASEAAKAKAHQQQQQQLKNAQQAKPNL